MRRLYLSNNSCGYYRVVFIDPVTGALSTGKSTHCKDKIEAAVVASSWLKDGVPVSRGIRDLFLLHTVRGFRWSFRGLPGGLRNLVLFL